ncbi:hypothetical protein [Deinococcus budaensis]|uniref:Uncharacterized protein n=1 Tax=Deinococcus budaensis TaxID=1665626 RepID=A0A7W8GEE4_9DEIO|nr:hypothetical protein [Deinococcus budaensis]MBB5233834.1 hypothetical protein [Deinococcus budaensis]
MLSRDFLERRNALWARLRALAPGTPEFEATLGDLAALTGWSRERVLAGLGLSGAGAARPPEPERP